MNHLNQKKIKTTPINKITKRNKRYYVMYESKLTTEKNTQITELKKKKKPVRQPSPRIEEKIIMKKKKKYPIWKTL